MTTLNLHAAKGFSKIFSKMGGAAVAVGLLACIAFSSPTNATTFTLAQLDAGQDFTIGNLEFFDFDVDVTTANTNLITVDTVDSEVLPGFVVNGNGQWIVQGNPVGDFPEELNYTFSVRTVDGRPLIGGALLWATDYIIVNGSGLDITLADQPGLIDLNVSIIELSDAFTGIEIPDTVADGDALVPPLSSLALGTDMELRLYGEAGPRGPGRLNSYATLFNVVPEPGTALLLGLGLAGLGVAGRSRRQESKATT